MAPILHVLDENKVIENILLIRKVIKYFQSPCSIE